MTPRSKDTIVLRILTTQRLGGWVVSAETSGHGPSVIAVVTTRSIASPPAMSIGRLLVAAARLSELPIGVT
jgi:hypothetical protein